MAEDRKFKFEGGRFVNRVSGEPIPDDEPVIIFRARDRHALSVLHHYCHLATDEHHQRAIKDRIGEFAAYQEAHPERLKEPGITRHIRLNDDPAPPSVSSEEEWRNAANEFRRLSGFQGYISDERAIEAVKAIVAASPNSPSLDIGE